MNFQPSTTDELSRWGSPKRQQMLPCRAARQRALGAVAFAGAKQAVIAARGRSKAGSFFAVTAKGFASTPWPCRRGALRKDVAQLLEFMAVVVDFATGEKSEVDDGLSEPGRNRSGA